jgi:membrane associated rhomboid family serine protease
MLIPLTSKISLRHPPVVTILIVLLNCFVYLVFQLDDDRHRRDAINSYFEAGLAAIELPYYLRYSGEEPEGIDFAGGHNAEEDTLLLELLLEMEGDAAFMRMLRQEQFITSTNQHYSRWKTLRRSYENKLGRVTSMTWGFRPASAKPATLLTYMFLHGGIAHLVGNMVFLWIVGCILEMGCGRATYTLLYLAGGVVAVLFYWLFNLDSTMPLVGASGAIAALMGAFTVLFGRTRVTIFFTLGFYFSIHKIPGIALLPFWVGNEFFQMASNESSNVAYLAHVGGLLGGAVLGFLLLRFPRAVDRTLFEEAPKDEIKPLIARALDSMGRLEMETARSLLDEVIRKAPGHIEALTHLFAIDKVSPGSRNFHQTTAKLLQALLEEGHSHPKVVSVYMEYRSLARPPRLPTALYLRLCPALCSAGRVNHAAGLVSSILKKHPELPGLPGALMKLADTYAQTGEKKKRSQCLHVLIKRFPATPEAVIAKRGIAQFDTQS